MMQRAVNRESPGPVEPLKLFPCSLAQVRFWILEKLQPGNSALNVSVRWRLDGNVSDDTIETAFRSLIDRHEILRTRFVDEDGDPLQEPLPSVSFKPNVVDLRHLPEVKRVPEALELGAREARLIFDISSAPLLRASVARLADDQTIITMTIHHIATDGWSMGILVREFGELVAAISEARSADLPPLELQYADFCLWQKEDMASRGFAADRAYWSRQLAGLQYFEVAPDKTRPATRTSKGDIRSRLLPRDLTLSLETFSRSQGCTLFATVAAALAAALRHVTGKDEIVVGTQVAGREEIELEPIVGLFINSLVLRFDTARDPVMSSLVGRCADVIREALIHQRMPFELLVEMLKPKRDLGRTPLYSVNLVVQRAFVETARYGDLELTAIPSPSCGSLYDLHFFMVERPEGWRLSCEYNTDLFLASTVDRLIELAQSAMEAISKTPDARLSEWSPARPSTAERAPLSSTEEKLAAIWRQLLNINELGPDAHFFDLGGHSLLAVRMLARVQKAFGKQLHFAEIVQFPVLRDLAAKLDRDDEVDLEGRIVRIQPSGNRTPVIALNNRSIYHPMAVALGKDRPFIDIHVVDMLPLEDREKQTFELIAARTVELIRHAQPRGPYILTGHCILGTLAIEAARALQKAGEEVTLVALKDSIAPGYIEDMPRRDRFLRRVMIFHRIIAQRLAELSRVRKGEIPFVAFLSGFSIVRRLKLLEGLARLRIVPPLPQTLEHFINWEYALYLQEVRKKYRCPSYSGAVVIFRSGQAMSGRLFDRQFGWGGIVKGTLEVVDVPGDHFSMTREPAATVIATKMNEMLDKIEGRARTDAPRGSSGR